MGSVAIANLQYLAASAFFIVGVKGLSHPRTAVRGNLLAAVGMLIACIAVVVAAALIEAMSGGTVLGNRVLIAGIASAVIGAVTFTGSLVAYGKLSQALPQ